jgi:hypothetical protein
MIIGPQLPTPTMAPSPFFDLGNISSFFALSEMAAGFWGGLFGGFFAGWFTNHFESKRRVNDKRVEKYFEHRNTIVQLEQELTPLRVNMSRNLASITDAIENTNDDNVRFVLRFDKLFLSSGLGLKLLSLDLINMYADLYSSVEKLNSDIDYVSGIVAAFREDQKDRKVDFSLINSYRIYLPYLKDICDETDKKSLELLAVSKVAIGDDSDEIKNLYIKNGKEIQYSIDKTLLSQRCDAIREEENPSSHKNEDKPKFVSLFLDFKKVMV